MVLPLAASLVVGALVGPRLLETAEAHVTSNVAHLWKKHIMKRADRRYVNQRTSTVTIPFAAFSPLSSSDAYSMTSQAVGGQTGTHALFAPVTLPDRARIIRVACDFYDVSTASDVGCIVRWTPTDAGLVSSVAGNMVSSGSGGYQRLTTTSISHPSVNNDGRVYYAQIEPDAVWDGTNAMVIGVAITYTLD